MIKKTLFTTFHTFAEPFAAFYYLQTIYFGLLIDKSQCWLLISKKISSHSKYINIYLVMYVFPFYRIKKLKTHVNLYVHTLYIVQY